MWRWEYRLVYDNQISRQPILLAVYVDVMGTGGTSKQRCFESNTQKLDRPSQKGVIHLHCYIKKYLAFSFLYCKQTGPAFFGHSVTLHLYVPQFNQMGESIMMAYAFASGSHCFMPYLKHKEICIFLLRCIL